MKFYPRKTWIRRTQKLNARRGETVWTRQLVRYFNENGKMCVRVYFSNKDQPAFRCEFIREEGDKHLAVRGPDGALYIVHKSYAGKNPACTVSFEGQYRPASSIALKCIRNPPGTSQPDASTEDLSLREEYALQTP